MSVVLLAGFFVLPTSCKDENYYTVEVVQPETPQEVPDSTIYRSPIQNIRNLDYFIGMDDLNPAYILQAEGIKKMYSSIPFIEKNVTDCLLMTIEIPENPMKVTIVAQDSEISNPFTCSITFTEEDVKKSGTIADYFLPMNWDYRALASWNKSRKVNLLWDIYADGQWVDTYVYSPICRSIHDVAFGLSWFCDDSSEVMNEMEGYPVWLDKEGETEIVYVSFNSLAAGYIDEYSPLIDRMKKEVISDGYLSQLFGGISVDDAGYIQAVEAFAYLMQKYNVEYTFRNSNDLQYVRTIDEVFGLSQGFCVELSCAFASWCINLGLNVYFINIPGHVYPAVKLPSGSLYSWDPNQLCYLDYPDLKQPGEEAFKKALENFHTIQEISATYFEEDMKNIEAGASFYVLEDMNAVRFYVPSFNISDSYWQTTTRSVIGRQPQRIADPVFLKMLRQGVKPQVVPFVDIPRH